MPGHLGFFQPKIKFNPRALLKSNITPPKKRRITPIIQCRKCGHLGKSAGDGFCQNCFNEKRLKGLTIIAHGRSLLESRSPYPYRYTTGHIKLPLLLKSPLVRETLKQTSPEWRLGISFDPGQFEDDTFQSVYLNPEKTVTALMARMKNDHTYNFVAIYFLSESWTPQKIAEFLYSIGYDTNVMMESAEIGRFKTLHNSKIPVGFKLKPGMKWYE